MDDENKRAENDQDYHEDFDDIFEIGIPVDETLSNQSADKSSGTESDQGDSSIKEVSDKDTPDDESSVPSPFDEIKAQLTELSQAFDSKLKYDDHKNKIIDELHQTLQEYREGLVKKYLHRIVTDIIKIVDDMRKFSSHYKNQPASDDIIQKLIKYIENIASDLEDLFAWEGVVPFTCDGDTIDPSRQRILNKIETDDPAKDKKVAERLRPGYEWDGKIIRPEMVSAYIYQTESTAEDKNN